MLSGIVIGLVVGALSYRIFVAVELSRQAKLGAVKQEPEEGGRDTANSPSGEQTRLGEGTGPSGARLVDALTFGMSDLDTFCAWHTQRPGPALIPSGIAWHMRMVEHVPSGITLLPIWFQGKWTRAGLAQATEDANALLPGSHLWVRAGRHACTTLLVVCDDGGGRRAGYSPLRRAARGVVVALRASGIERNLEVPRLRPTPEGGFNLEGVRAVVEADMRASGSAIFSPDVKDYPSTDRGAPPHWTKWWHGRGSNHRAEHDETMEPMNPYSLSPQDHLAELVRREREL